VLQNNGSEKTADTCPVSTCYEGPTQELMADNDEGGPDVDITNGGFDPNKHILIDPTANAVDISAISVIPTIDMASTPTNGPIPLTATATSVALYGTIGTASPFASVTVTATATDGTATVTGGIGSPVIPGAMGPVATDVPSGVVLSGTQIAVGGNITTAGGQVTFDGATVLAGDTRIDTTVGTDGGGAT